MIPEIMDGPTLAAVLHDMADCVHTHTSRNGHIEYDLEPDSDPPSYHVFGSYRTEGSVAHGTSRRTIGTPDEA